MNVAKIVKLVKNTVVPVMTKVVRKVKRNSPDILMGAGVISIVAGTISACKATLKVDSIVKETNEKYAEIETSVGKTCKDGSVYSSETRDNDRELLKTQTRFKVVKAYIIPFLLVVGGIALTITGHNILKDRYTTLVAGYNNVMAAYNILKAKTNCETIEPTDSNEDSIQDVSEKVEYEDVRFLFDELSPAFVKNNVTNASYLKGILRTVNYRFSNTNEPILLNDVLDMLRIPRTKMGAQIGWAKENGDEYISFGPYCDKFIEECSNHELDNIGPNGIELVFNVGGVVINYL